MITGVSDDISTAPISDLAQAIDALAADGYETHESGLGTIYIASTHRFRFYAFDGGRLRRAARRARRRRRVRPRPLRLAEGVMSAAPSATTVADTTTRERMDDYLDGIADEMRMEWRKRRGDRAEGESFAHWYILEVIGAIALHVARAAVTEWDLGAIAVQLYARHLAAGGLLVTLPHAVPDLLASYEMLEQLPLPMMPQPREQASATHAPPPTTTAPEPRPWIVVVTYDRRRRCEHGFVSLIDATKAHGLLLETLGTMSSVTGAGVEIALYTPTGQVATRSIFGGRALA